MIGKGKPQDRSVEDDERKVVRPADDPRDLPPAARRRHFPQRHGPQDAKKGGKADRRFGGEDGLGHGVWTSGLWGATELAIIQVIA